MGKITLTLILLITVSAAHTQLIKNQKSISADYSTLCDTPKFKNHFPSFCGIPQYFDYYQAVECQKESGKPLLIYFTGWHSVNSRKMEKEVLCDSAVQKLLINFIIVTLYVDDELVGNENAKLQQNEYKANFQPLFVVASLNSDQKIQGEIRYTSKEKMLDFLKSFLR